MTIKHLASKGHSGREIARLLGVCESTVRYHLERQATGAVDGRALQPQLAEDWSEKIDWYRQGLGKGPVNLADLYDWLKMEHDYPGSLRSVQRYYRKRYPKPKRRARRRVETPPGAQAQVDWAEWPRVWIGGRVVYAYQFHMRLSHSRFGARVWSPRKDQLSWHHVHNEAFRRLGRRACDGARGQREDGGVPRRGRVGRAQRELSQVRACGALPRRRLSASESRLQGQGGARHP